MRKVGEINAGWVACSRYSVSMFRSWMSLHAHGVPRAWHPILFVLIVTTLAQANDNPFGLADLEAYRQALGSKPVGSAPRVTFRDLWDRPKDFAGRSVMVEGRVARIFRKAALGEFPPLVEAWVVSPVGDPFCLVFPDGSEPVWPEIGHSVQFSGTFVRRIPYQAGDTERLVPLIVGPEPPTRLASLMGADRWSWATIDGILGLGALAMVATILLRLHWSRPVARPTTHEPHPLFVDGDPDPSLEAATDESSD